jgi:hypothetical protein
MSSESFWNQVSRYNQDTILIQIILLAIIVILIYYLFARPGKKTDTCLKVYFVFLFAWNGAVFFLLYASNPISTYFGAPLFFILAIFFLVDLFTKGTQFRIPEVRWKRAATLIWFLLVLFYPLIGLAFSHTYPAIITPLMPCPMTVLAIALMTSSSPRTNRIILLLLLSWALAGLPKCLGALDCYEDCILFAAGVYGLVILVKDWKAIGRFQE